MKKLQGSKLAILLIALMISTISFVGCNNENMSTVSGPDITTNHDGHSGILAKRKGGGGGGNVSSYPQTVSKTIGFNSTWQQYRGAAMKLPNGTQFFINSGYLTPPADHPFGQPVTLTITADLDPVSNNVIYSFGPHGCTFRPKATLTLDWSDMGNDVPTLYYIDENGNYQQQNPNQVDPWNNKMYLYLGHFSRYALAQD